MYTKAAAFRREAMIYRVYGIRLASELPLLEPTAAPGLPVDIHLRIDESGPQPIDDGNSTLMFEGQLRVEEQALFQVYRRDAGYVLRYLSVGDFEILKHGHEIVCRPARGASVEDIRACVLGPALAVCFQVQGRPVLHASATVIDGRAVAFVDWSGGGKSTLAAAFASAGYSFLTDDALVLSESGGLFYGAPGYPVHRLWPDAIAALIGVPDQFQRVRPNRDKRRVPVGEMFHDARCPVAVIYLLGMDDAARAAASATLVQPVTQADAVPALIRNAYGAMWLDADIRARQFGDYCRLASSVPVRRVSFAREWSQLAAVRAAIVSDVRSLASPVAAIS